MKKYSSKKLGMIAVVVLASGLATQAQVTIFTQGLSTDSTPKLQGNGGDISVASVTINSPTVFNMNGNWTTTGAGYGFVQAAWQDKAVAANVGNSDTTPSDYILSFDALATSGNQNSAWSGVGGLNVQIQVWANNYFAGTETILQAGGESGNGYQDLTVS
ncbi:MAG: hypothetical protein ABSA69_08745, partial [Verrucomicrobiota bacterium]